MPDPQTREARLLGLAVAEALEALSFDDTLPAPMRTGVILAGDLYSVPAANKRGGFGDVAEVWAAFAARFKWVAGVAGNHDDVRTLRPADNLHLLDTEGVLLDTLRIGGVGLIAGNPERVGRRAEVDQLERIELVALEGLDVLVLHEGPEGDRLQPGNPLIRELVVGQSVPLTVCGHAHWGAPLFRLPRGQVLNVDARVVVMTR